MNDESVNERRRAPRETLDPPFNAEVLFQDHTGLRAIPARLLDHSRHGAQIVADSAEIHVGMIVMVKAPGGAYVAPEGQSAEVVWTTREGEMTRFGCEFVPLFGTASG